MNPGSTSQDPIADPTTAVAEAMSAPAFPRARERGGVEADHLPHAALGRARANGDPKPVPHPAAGGLRGG